MELLLAKAVLKEQKFVLREKHWNFPKGQKSFTNISKGPKPVPAPDKALRKYLFKTPAATPLHPTMY